MIEGVVVDGMKNAWKVQIETVREIETVNVVQKEGVPEVETEIVTVKGAGGHEAVIVRGDAPDPEREECQRKEKRGRSAATGLGPGIANVAQGHVTGSIVGTGTVRGGSGCLVKKLRKVLSKSSKNQRMIIQIMAVTITIITP